jgi:histidinol-phosphate aminotransferase
MATVTAPIPKRHISFLAPYALADLTAGGSGRTIQLAQNENASPPSTAALEAARATLTNVNRYPEGDAASLRHAIAAAEKLQPERIICAAGSMELLSLLAQSYLAPGDEAVVSQYGYLFFRSVIELSGAAVVLAPERDYVADIDAMLDKVGPKTRMVFLANPNNPTGSLLGNAELSAFRASLRDDVLLILDGAYAEYVTQPGFDPGIELVKATSNTVMLRTFSKIHGLAGLRVGWGYFPQAIADIVNRVRLPNLVTAPALAAAEVAIADRVHADGMRRSNAEIRDRFAEALRGMGLAPLPSHTNFVLLPFAAPTEAAAAQEFLKAQGIVIRPMGGYDLGHCLRITIGASDEMAALLTTIEAWISRR